MIADRPLLVTMKPNGESMIRSDTSAPTTPYGIPAKTIQVERKTHLPTLALGEDSVIHRHIIIPKVQVNATSPDGVIEGLEAADGRVLTVQCHPESLVNAPWARALFKAYVAAAADRSRSRAAA